MDNIASGRANGRKTALNVVERLNDLILATVGELQVAMRATLAQIFYPTPNSQGLGIVQLISCISAISWSRITSWFPSFTVTIASIFLPSELDMSGSSLGISSVGCLPSLSSPVSLARLFLRE